MAGILGTLAGALDVQTMNGMVETFANEPGQDLFSRLFAKGRKLDTDDYGMTCAWEEATMPRGLAPVMGDESPAPKVAVTQRIVRSSPMVHVKHSVDIPPRKLYRERAEGQLGPDPAAVVATQLKALTKRVKLTKEYICAQAAQGTLVVSPTTIEGSELTLGASALLQTTSTLAGGVWTSAATQIAATEIPLLSAAYVQASGMAPGQSIVNDVLERSIVGNTEIQNLAKQQGGLQILQNEVASEQVAGGMTLGGMKWSKAYGGYVPVSSGTFTRWLGNTKIVTLPTDADLPDVLGLAEGYGFVPDAPIGSGPGAASLVKPAPQRGFYAYAVCDPVTLVVTLIVGWVGMAVLVFPAGSLVTTIS